MFSSISRPHTNPRGLGESVTLKALGLGAKGDHTLVWDDTAQEWFVQRGSRRWPAQYQLEEALRGVRQYEPTTGKCRINWKAVPQVILRHCNLVVE